MSIPNQKERVERLKTWKLLSIASIVLNVLFAGCKSISLISRFRDENADVGQSIDITWLLNIVTKTMCGLLVLLAILAVLAVLYMILGTKDRTRRVTKNLLCIFAIVMLAIACLFSVLSFFQKTNSIEGTLYALAFYLLTLFLTLTLIVALHEANEDEDTAKFRNITFWSMAVFAIFLSFSF